jgi:hypothetical protein
MDTNLNVSEAYRVLNQGLFPLVSEAIAAATLRPVFALERGLAGAFVVCPSEAD